MKSLLTAVFAAAVAFASPSFAAEPSVKERLVVGANVIALKDGGSITLDKQGRTYHVDAAGKRVRMKDGVVMEAKDGTRYVHKNDALWQQIAVKGTLAPNR